MESAHRQPSKSVVISHLPLIFSRGCPSSVDKLDGDALVDFVRFLLRCALGVDEAGLKSIKRPLWWPRTVPYFNFNARKEVKKGHARRLRELVERCYRTNQCGYLLDLATRLSQLFDQGRLHLVAGYDGTTALCESDSSRLVVSCRNENVNYDKTGAGMASPRRLLPVQSAKSRSGAAGGATCHAGGMVQPPLCDIYLCDNCTAEFATIAEVRTHELTCGVAAPAEYAQQEPDACHTDETPASLGFSATDQDTFLGCLGLVSASKSTATGIPPVGLVHHSGSQSVQSGRGGGGGGVVRRALRARVPLFVAMCRIDVSSPLGRRLMRRDGQRARLLTADQMAAAIRGYEQHCRSKATHVYGPQRYPSSWKAPRCRRRGPDSPMWHHTICFNWRQRRDRLATIRTGLSRRSRALLARTRPCRVLATRLCPASSSTTLPALCHKTAKPLINGGASLATTTTAAAAAPPAVAAPAVAAPAVAAAAVQLHPAAVEAAWSGPDNSSVTSLSVTNYQRPPEVRPALSPKSQSAPLAPAGTTVSCGGGGDGRASGGGRDRQGSSDVGAQCASGGVRAGGGNSEVQGASGGGGGTMEQLTSLLLRLPRPIGRMVQTVTGAVVDLCSSDSDSGDNCDNSDIVTRADNGVNRCVTSTALPKRRSLGADGVLSGGTAKSPLSQTTVLPPLPPPPLLLPLSLETAANNNSNTRRHHNHATHSRSVPSLTGTAAAAPPPPPLLPLGLLSSRSLTTAAPPAAAALHSRRSVSSTGRAAGTAAASPPVLQPGGLVSSRGPAADAGDTLCDRASRSPRTVRPPHSTSPRNSTLHAHSKNGISHWPELDKNLANGCSQLQFLSAERRPLACVVVGSVSAAMPRAVL